MKPRPKDREWYRRKIRKINREFKNIARAVAQKEKLIDLKDKLIDALVAQCAHTSLIEAPPEQGGFGPTSHTPVRACLLCGEVEYAEEEWLTLTGPAEVINRRDFSIQLGLVLKDLGINL